MSFASCIKVSPIPAPRQVSRTKRSATKQRLRGRIHPEARKVDQITGGLPILLGDQEMGRRIPNRKAGPQSRAISASVPDSLSSMAVQIIDELPHHCFQNREIIPETRTDDRHSIAIRAAATARPSDNKTLYVRQAAPVSMGFERNTLRPHWHFEVRGRSSACGDRSQSEALRPRPICPRAASDSAVSSSNRATGQASLLSGKTRTDPWNCCPLTLNGQSP